MGRRRRGRRGHELALELWSAQIRAERPPYEPPVERITGEWELPF